jgi:hypothetical protein
MPVMKRDSALRRVGYGLAMAGFLLLTDCVRLTPLPPLKSDVDMFSVYDGRPSTATERNGAVNDCSAYLNASVYTQTTLTNGIQICMLQLGFRAPSGELPGRSGLLQATLNGCAGEPGDPVCWAVKYGWPQNPPLRWAKPDIDRSQLEGDWSNCYGTYQIVPYPRRVVAMDRCMAQRFGFRVIHPHSPEDLWLARDQWPSCKKPAAEMNWLEKKWCPGRRPLPPSATTTGQ